MLTKKKSWWCPVNFSFFSFNVYSYLFYIRTHNILKRLFSIDKDYASCIVHYKTIMNDTPSEK